MWVCGYEIVGVMYRLRLRQLSRSTTRKSKSKAPSGSPGGVFIYGKLARPSAQSVNFCGCLLISEMFAVILIIKDRD